MKSLDDDCEVPEIGKIFPRWIKRLIIALSVMVAVYLLNQFFDPFISTSTRAPVSVARHEMRSIATAFESYYIDYNSYPESVPMMDMIKTPTEREYARALGLRTYDFEALLPPEGTERYLPEQKYDPFGLEGNKTPFAYARMNTLELNVSPGFDGADWWVLYSTGPDRDYNLRLPQYVTGADGKFSRDESGRVAYDPTNGTFSSGDILRQKQ